MLTSILPRVKFVLSLVTLLTTSACGGLLIVEPAGSVPCVSSAQCGLGFVCDTTVGRCVEAEGPCSLQFPNGDCPRGTVCADALCVCTDPAICGCSGDGCNGSYCDCEPAQGCDAGLCVEIITTGPNANSCDPARPNGLCAGNRDCCEGGDTCCPSGEICLADHCVPEPEACSPSNLRGLCPAGLACQDGRCIPEVLCACSADNLNGCCDVGEVCSNGACANVPCSPGVLGECPVDRTCVVATGQCVAVPCSPDHLTGSCSGGERCGSEGNCLAAGECDTIADCGLNEYCGTGGECLAGGVCGDDLDCTVVLESAFGQGFQCVGDACVERVDCATGDDCIPEKFCSAQGHCLAADRCDDDRDCEMTHYCSAGGTCALDGTCAVDEDCDGGAFCAASLQCLNPGTCSNATDCPPGHLCDTSGGGPVGTCEVTGEQCTSDAFKTIGCAPGEVVCCESGDCCDALGEQCSAAGSCIPVGLCVDDSDCLAGYATCVDYQCVPSKSCLTCTASEVCTSVQVGAQTVSGCVPNDRCLTDLDCGNRGTCNAEHTCVPNGVCGAEVVSLGSLVPPNVLVVLDRSGSMNICGAGDALDGPCAANSGSCNATVDCCSCNTGSGCQESFSGSGVACDCDRDCNAASCACNTTASCDASCYCDPDCGFCACNTGPGCQASCACDRDCAATPPLCSSNLCINPSCTTGGDGSTTTRWSDAKDAIDQITADFAGRARFGMAIYPVVGASDACSVPCRWVTCSGSTNETPGIVEVPIADDTRADIQTALTGTAPGGHTPTSATLRNILSSGDLGGLADPDRQNAVLLVTDGEATSDTVTVKYCEPACGNITKDGDETDVDCGGSCDGCMEGAACARNDDCASRVCRDGVCRAESCADEDKNNSETDIDCGGACGACADTALCGGAADCQSGVCANDQCAAPSCSDTVKNGSETAADCGGACQADCADGLGCSVNEDCTSGVCQDGTCRAASCGNGMLDLNETDVDCGDTCGKCLAGDDCGDGDDCVTGECTTGTCTVPSCANGMRDGDETDVDCGGSCADCNAGKACDVDGDCAGTCRDCGNVSDQACRVNGAIAGLYGVDPRVKTFVVGFAFDGTSSNLNCHATYGRSARRDVAGCEDITRDTCATEPSVCYYDAADRASLTGVLNDILDQVSSCTYDLNVPVTGLFGLDLYLLGSSGAFTPLRRNTQWMLLPNRRQVELTGSACDTVKADDAEVVVVYHCPNEG